MDEEDYAIGATVEIKVEETTRKDILAYINLVDASKPWNIPEVNAPMYELKDYYTKPAYKTLKNGKKVIARGPLANSLYEGLKNTIKMGRVKWVTVLDKNTGRRDRELDGKIWKVNDFAAPIPPLHINCRCHRESIADDNGAYL